MQFRFLLEYLGAHITVRAEQDYVGRWKKEKFEKILKQKMSTDSVTLPILLPSCYNVLKSLLKGDGGTLQLHFKNPLYAALKRQRNGEKKRASLMTSNKKCVLRLILLSQTWPSLYYKSFLVHMVYSFKDRRSNSSRNANRTRNEDWWSKFRDSQHSSKVASED